MSVNAARLRLGFDIGGTFTDFVLVDAVEQRIHLHKCLTTPHDPSQGALAGMSELLARVGVSLSDIGHIVHGTTLVANAIIERSGCKLGFLTTKGFRDILEMGTEQRYDIHDLFLKFPAPLVPRRWRREVDERVTRDGEVVTSLDIDQVRQQVDDLVAGGVEAIAVCLLHSYKYPAHEQAIRDLLRTEFPRLAVSISSEIYPELKEFERSSTTAANAYVQPLMGAYVEKLETALAQQGFTGRFHLMQSSGGLTAPSTAIELPVRFLESGPAGGARATAFIGETIGKQDIISFDMGGTTAKACLILGGKPDIATMLEAGRVHRFKRGSGLPIQAPVIDMIEIGAGGGSIARVDDLGLLKVGPHSAGADPGPACYGLGNTRPTITDANVLLGRINAERPIGGNLASLDKAAAEAAILAHVGAPLGLDATAAAAAIVRVANGLMAGAIRLVSIERGHDPRKFVAMPFGGGGALHVGALLREVGLAKALVPRYPGVISALGCAIADMRDDSVVTVNRTLEELDGAELKARMDALAVGSDDLVGEGAKYSFAADMSYQGQSHTVEVPLADGPNCDAPALRAAFEARYREVYGRLLDGIPIRLLNLRLTALAHREAFDLSVLAPPPDASREKAEIGVRPVWSDGDWRETPIYDRLTLPPGAIVPGPAILEQPDGTIFVDPGLVGEVDGFGNLIVARSND